MAVSGIAPRDLWEGALATLKTEDKQHLDFGQPSQQIIEDVLVAVKDKRVLCIQRRWKYRKSNGEVLILRDIFEKIVTWVDKFKEVGDVAVQYDPAHAALPWAAMRFFLQMAVNDVQIFGSMTEGLERVSNLVVRSKIFEIIYLQENSTAKSHLEEALIRLYAAILTYLAAARLYYERSTIRRIGQSLVQTPESVDCLLRRVSEEQDLVEYWGKLVDAERQRDISITLSSTHVSVDTICNDMQGLVISVDTNQKAVNLKLEQILHSLQQPIVRIVDQVTELHDNLKREERLEIFRWMSTVPYREHHKNSWKEVLLDSGLWVQLRKEYLRWKGSSASSVLWLHGIPGSGKTKLVSTIIQSFLAERTRNPSSTPVTYFYCARDAAEAKRADPDEVLRAIVKQLSCSDSNKPIRDPVLQEYQMRLKEAEEDGTDPTKLSIEDSTELILALTEQTPAIIIIDALDECDPLRRHELLNSLKVIIEKSASLIKVLISSRDDMDIVLRLASLPNIFIKADENKEDIDRFICFEVEQAINNQRLLNGKVSTELKLYIINKLTSGAHGMFRWASLQIQNLCDPRRMKLEADVRKALDRPPKALSELYAAVYAQILQLEPEGRSVAEKALKWLLCAQRPLSSHEFISAVSSGSIWVSSQIITTEDILGLCCNFVVLDTELDNFRLAHLSVREYLESRSDYSSKNIHTLAVERCLEVYAKEPEFSLLRERTPEQTAVDLALQKKKILRKYATVYWIVHYENVELEQGGDILRARVLDVFFRGSYAQGQFNEWMHATREFSSTIDIQDPLADKFAGIQSFPITPLHTFCTFGLLEIMKEPSVFKLIDLNQKNNEGETGLFLAAWHGHVNTVEFLISQNVDFKAINDFGETALHRAAASGHAMVLRLLIENGADLAESDDNGWTSLDWAVKGRHEEAILLLLEEGAEEEAIAKYGDSLLCWASNRQARSYQNMYGEREWTDIDFTTCISRPTGYTGIHNEGQIGYLTTILQLLFILRPIHEALFQPTSWTRPSFVPALKQVFARLKTSQETISARDLTRAFGWEERQLSEPQDPMRFLDLLLFRIDELLNQNQGASIHDIFCIQFKNKKSQRREESWSLMLNDYPLANITEALQSRIMDEDYYIDYLPPVLILYLTRFTFNLEENRLDKLHDRIEFPSILTVEAPQGHDEAGPRNYVLHGVVVNRGGMEGAKAYAFLKPQKDGRWIKFRNEQVIFATSKEAIEDNFGPGEPPERIATSCTAQGLLYLEESMLDRLLGPTDDIDVTHCHEADSGTDLNLETDSALMLYT